MANGMVLSNLHNYYMSTYTPKSASRYDTHKKSELRGIYNSIVKLNKESPLYKLDTSKESRSFAVGVKEDARALRNTIISLGGINEEELLNKKVAYSSNEDILTASYIGKPIENSDTPSFNIEVQSLASGQVNLGNFLSNSKVKLSPDTYSFDITINDLNYEFQYNIHEGETNKDVQERLAKLVTNAGIGIKAEVAEDGKGTSALRLRSNEEGLRENNSSIFTISDSHTSKQSGSVDYFGLDYMTRSASNAQFLLNGETHSTCSNNFTIDKLFELNLKGVSAEGESVSVGLKTDVESLTENVETLVQSYNKFIGNTSKYIDNISGSNRLLNEMRSILGKYQSNFDIIGLKAEQNGTVSIDKNDLKHAALSDFAKEDFTSIRNFANSLINKTDQISINPMDYANKVIVAYKNPGRNFATPYITSAYSGMLFNSYC